MAQWLPFRWRLRTLLVGVLLLSLAFGLHRRQYDRAQFELRRAQEAEQMGLGVTWRTLRPQWLWRRLPSPNQGPCRSVVALSTDARTVWASSDEPQTIRDEAIQVASAFTGLRSLELPYVANNRGPYVTVLLSDQGLAPLSRLSALETLNLAHQPITDAGLQYLKSLQRLRRLDISGTRISTQAIEQWRAARPQLEIVGP
jgi:hypothetical protein